MVFDRLVTLHALAVRLGLGGDASRNAGGVHCAARLRDCRGGGKGGDPRRLAGTARVVQHALGGWLGERTCAGEILDAATERHPALVEDVEVELLVPALPRLGLPVRCCLVGVSETSRVPGQCTRCSRSYMDGCVTYSSRTVVQAA